MTHIYDCQFVGCQLLLVIEVETRNSDYLFHVVEDGSCELEFGLSN